MRLYPASSEETLRARKLLAEWAGERFLTQAQYERLQLETVSPLRTTNVFLRLVLFLFTLIGVGAAVALFFLVFLARPPRQSLGIVLLLFAAVCYAAAEFAASRLHLYRYGIEEGLAASSVALLCAGLQAALFAFSPSSLYEGGPRILVPAAGAALSLWIWRRFGLPYAFLAAMIFVLFLPGYWTSSLAAQHAIVTVFYAAALLGIIALRSRHHLDPADRADSLIEALLWLGIYLAINLKLSSSDLLPQGWGAGMQSGSAFNRHFYWTTFVLIWCLPPLVLARGVRRRDRFVMAVGALTAILTFVSNKPYLGWPRHSWDPMLLGIVLTGSALLLRRWLSRGPGEIRHGFTAARLSEKDRNWMHAGSALAGLVSPQSITPGPSTSTPDFQFGGGASGGGGAEGDF